MSNLDMNTLPQQIAQTMIDRLADLGLSPEEYQGDCSILMQFADIAASQLAQEPGIEGIDPNQPIPLDDNMMVQGLTLFCEGLYYGLYKFAKMGIGGQLKQEMLQELALSIYEQSKQIVAATYGQEHTPEFQFTHEQQVEFVQKAAEGYLMAKVAEYESVHGPLIPPEFLEMEEEHAEIPQFPEELGAPPAALMPTSPIAAVNRSGAVKNGPSPHDKYAAVALLLTTMPTEQRGRFLRVFTEQEKELITYYSYPQHVEQELDLASVEAHLRKLKLALKKANQSSKSVARKGLLALVGNHPPEKLLSWVKDERPLVKHHLEAYYTRQAGQALLQAEGQPSHLDPLPPRIEEILYRYLAKRLELGRRKP